MSKLNQFKEVKQQYENFRKTITEQFLNECVEELKGKHGDFAIVIRGYTPSFNDGEPCEHSSSYSLCVGHTVSSNGNYKWFKHDELEASDNEELSEFLEINNEEMTSINSKFEGNSDFFSDMEALHDVVSEAFETDYEVKIKVKGGVITIDHDYYDCGY